MSAQSTVPRGRYGFERRGWWSSLVVMVVMATLWIGPAAIGDTIPDSRSTPVDPAATYALTADDGVAGTVKPANDWTTNTGTSGADLTFESGATSFTAHLDSNVEDVNRLWDRRVRQFELATPPMRMTRNGTYTASTGLSGPAGTITGGKVTGEAFLLSADGPDGYVAMVSVAGPAGALAKHTTDFDAFLDSVELKP